MNEHWQFKKRKKRYSIMKKMAVIISFVISMMIAACGSQATPAQASSGKDPAAEVKQEAEQAQAQEDPAATAQEAETQVSEQAPEEKDAEATPAQETEAKIDDVTSAKYWCVTDGRLLGLLGQDTFGFLCEVPKEMAITEAIGVAINDTRDQVLLKADTAFIKVDLINQDFAFINPGAINSWYDRANRYVYYVDTEGVEYVITDWTNPEKYTTENEPPKNYYGRKAEMEILDFEQFVTLMRENPEDAFDLCFYIDPNGNIYNFYCEYMSSVHIPIVDLNPAYPLKDSAAWISPENRIGIYSMGNELYSYQLPEGSWEIVGANDHAFLLYNTTDNTVYKLIDDQLAQVMEADDVQTDGDDAYIYSDGSGYFGNWITGEMEKVIECKGVSHYKDYPGFITEDGEITFNGVNITVR